MNAVIYNTNVGGEWIREIHIPSLDVSINSKGILREEQCSDIPSLSVNIDLSNDLVKRIAKIANDNLVSKGDTAVELLPELEKFWVELPELNERTNSIKNIEEFTLTDFVGSFFSSMPCLRRFFPD